MSEFPYPEINDLSRPLWDGLAEGRLMFQRCDSCENAWLPARSECPKCLRSDYTWETACGRASLVSWVIYHRAMHPAFADKVPYNVAIVELAEGPRLISNIDASNALLAIDMPLEFRPTVQGGMAISSFVIAGQTASDQSTPPVTDQ